MLQNMECAEPNQMRCRSGARIRGVNHHRSLRLRLLKFLKQAGGGTPVRQRKTGQDDVEVFIREATQTIQRAAEYSEGKEFRSQEPDSAAIQRFWVSK